MTNLRKYSYKLLFETGKVNVFEIYLEPKTLQIIRTKNDEPAEWTKLQYFKCEHCPLNLDKYKYCPLAVHLQELIEFFSEFESFEKVHVEVASPERTYSKDTDIQSAVSSMLGMIMPSSGCPILAKLRPMVRFHLPFASLDETEFRVLAMYVLAQFLRNEKGLEPDWNMNSLKTLYRDIQKLNKNVAKQIADLEKKDTSINSVVILNNFADAVTMNLDEEDYSKLYLIFDSWLKD